MYGLYEQRIGELYGVKGRLESRLQEVVAEIDYFEEAALRASHPLDVWRLPRRHVRTVRCVRGERVCRPVRLPSVEPGGLRDYRGSL